MTGSKSSEGVTSNSTRLVEVLRALSAKELQSLAARVGAHIDPNKRLDPASQLARVLVSQPEIRDLARLPSPSAQLLRRVAASGGLLEVSAVPAAVEPLTARGLLYVRELGPSLWTLVLPTALLLQIPPWEGEDPRGVRALFARATQETLGAIASQYVGRPVPSPVVLGLDGAWETLHQPKALARAIELLAFGERRLLEAIEQQGGEVDTEELLDLEREPFRVRGAQGVTPSRRGVGFSLERRGMLMPVPPNRHVIPTEVAAVIGAAHASHREGRRAQIRAIVLDRSYEPHRARFAQDPVPLALACALSVREWSAEVREGAGTPRSLIQRLAQRFGREPETVGVLAALSRALGLWDSAALSIHEPPGTMRLDQIRIALFSAWRQGAAWDEARPEPEALRLPLDARDASPVGLVREIVVEALHELGEGYWVPWESLADYVRADARTGAVSRLLRRWAERAGVAAPTPTDVARRIVLESLPALGVVDIGESHDDLVVEDLGPEAGPFVRLTGRGRALVQGKPLSAPDNSSSVFCDPYCLRVGSGATLASVLSLYSCAEVGKVGEVLELLLTQASIGRAISSGTESELIRARIEALAPVSPDVARLLDQMGVVLGQVSFVAASGFLWCDDPQVRELLRTRRLTADLFLEPSPPGGLLLGPGLSLEVVARRCRALGVELFVDGQLVRARSTLPPPKTEGPGSRRSTVPPRRSQLPGTRRTKVPTVG